MCYIRLCCVPLCYIHLCCVPCVIHPNVLYFSVVPVLCPLVCCLLAPCQCLLSPGPFLSVSGASWPPVSVCCILSSCQCLLPPCPFLSVSVVSWPLPVSVCCLPSVSVASWLPVSVCCLLAPSCQCLLHLWYVLLLQCHLLTSDLYHARCTLSQSDTNTDTDT